MLSAMGELYGNTFMFAEDTTSMCPNINIEKGLIFLTMPLDNPIFKVESNCPRTEIINDMKLLL